MVWPFAAWPSEASPSSTRTLREAKVDKPGMFECACCKTSLRLNEELRTPNRISSTSVVSIHMFRSALAYAIPRIFYEFGIR